MTGASYVSEACFGLSIYAIIDPFLGLLIWLLFLTAYPPDRQVLLVDGPRFFAAVYNWVFSGYVISYYTSNKPIDFILAIMGFASIIIYCISFCAGFCAIHDCTGCSIGESELDQLRAKVTARVDGIQRHQTIINNEIKEINDEIYRDRSRIVPVIGKISSFMEELLRLKRAREQARARERNTQEHDEEAQPVVEKKKASPSPSTGEYSHVPEDDIDAAVERLASGGIQVAELVNGAALSVRESGRIVTAVEVIDELNKE